MTPEMVKWDGLGRSPHTRPNQRENVMSEASTEMTGRQLGRMIHWRTMSATRFALLLTLSLNLSCASAKPAPTPVGTDPGLSAAAMRERATATAKERALITTRDSLFNANAALATRISALDLRLLDKEAQVEDLQARLEETRAAVVQAKTRSQTADGKAGAASAMAEAEVALQSLRSIAPPQYPDLVSATRILRQSTVAFDKKNYGGALFLAGQARSVASAARSRLSTTNRVRSVRTGETPFAVPVRLRVALAGPVRDGPGPRFPVVFSVEAGAAITGLSYAEDWVRVTDDRRRTGWINRRSVARR
jgi:hypothetical protein